MTANAIGRALHAGATITARVGAPTAGLVTLRCELPGDDNYAHCLLTDDDLLKGDGDVKVLLALQRVCSQAMQMAGVR